MNVLRHPAVIIVLILLVVLLFGSRRLPDFARSVGQSLKIFKKEVKELKEDDGGASQPGQAGTSASDAGSGTAAGSPTAGTGAAQDGTASTQVPGLVDPKQPRA